MGATGLALIAFTPQNGALTAMSWIWPVPVLALAVYIWVRARRDLPVRARWMLVPVVAVLALAPVAATYENISVVRDQHTYPAPGTSYEVHGHRLYLDCRGQGSPTVVLDNGLGEVTASWARIVAQVDTTTRVCAYDRAGQGWSQDTSSAQDGVMAARDLHTLLNVAGEHGPYLLVGHSIGGTYALTYAAQYPKQVAGMVLLDSSSPEQFTAIPSYAGQYAVVHRVMAVTPTLNRLGLGRVVTAVASSHLPPTAADQVTALTASAHGARSASAEWQVLPTLFTQAKDLTTFGSRPLAVITATESLAERRMGCSAKPSRSPLHPERPPRRRLDPHGPPRGPARLGRSRRCHRPRHRGHPQPLSPGQPMTAPQARVSLDSTATTATRKTTTEGVTMSTTTPAQHAASADTQQHQEHREDETGPKKSWALLGVALAAQILVVLDISVVNTALPSIGRSLGLGGSQLAWIVTAYLMMSGGGLLLGGRIADQLSRRTVFLTGLALFTAASLVSGFAETGGQLIATRSVQGLSAALLTPSALALIMTTYAGAQRKTALATWGAVGSLGVAAGVLLGGAITTWTSWQFIFWVNGPVGSRRAPRRHAGSSRSTRLPAPLSTPSTFRVPRPSSVAWPASSTHSAEPPPTAGGASTPPLRSPRRSRCW